LRIDVVMHNTTKVHQGDGTGLIEGTPAEDDLALANQISNSPTSSKTHWIVEFPFLKISGIIQMAEALGIKIALYDENNTVGVKTWPLTEQDIPNTWDIQNYTKDSCTGVAEPPSKPEVPEKPE
jgi:hypothetical protein